MSPLVLSENKLLVVNNKLAVDLNCCCCYELRYKRITSGDAYGQGALDDTIVAYETDENGVVKVNQHGNIIYALNCQMQQPAPLPDFPNYVQADDPFWCGTTGPPALWDVNPPQSGPLKARVPKIGGGYNFTGPSLIKCSGLPPLPTPVTKVQNATGEPTYPNPLAPNTVYTCITNVHGTLDGNPSNVEWVLVLV